MTDKATAQLADPMDALVSLQREVRRGMPTHPTRHGGDVRAVMDRPAGVRRITYARIEHGRVKAIALFVDNGSIDGIPCFNVGYAVPEAYRRRGWGRQIIEAGIQEMQYGLGRNGVKQFYVEAVVGKDNIASQQLAKQVFSDSPTEGTDEESGEPVLSYLRLISHATESNA